VKNNKLFIIVGIVFAIYAFFIIGIDNNQFSDIQKLGSLGDSFGLLTSLFTGLAFAGLLVTLQLQRQDLEKTHEELEATRKQMEFSRLDAISQSKERTFFSMLEMYMNIVNELEFIGPDYLESNKMGRGSFKSYVDLVNTNIRQLTPEEIINNNDTESASLIALESAYDYIYAPIYEDKQAELSHYFRYLYRMFKYITDECSDKSELYSKILRSQFTNYELALLFYNGVSSYGEKFKPYLEKYHIFDNLPTDILANPRHTYLYDREAWGDNLSYQDYVVIK
jgi:Putative phage abortive infection protein